jgi:hypothetical protein
LCADRKRVLVQLALIRSSIEKQEIGWDAIQFNAGVGRRYSVWILGI